MAGIAGIVELDGAPVDAGRVRKQAAMLAHRGTGKHWEYAHANVGMSCRQSGTLPPFAISDGPVRDHAGRYLMVACGGIYNAAAIAADLTARNVRSDDLDTHQLMIEAYATWRENAFTRFNGDFALAIWDTVDHELVLARDPLGHRQLFYFNDGSTVLFGSEVKAILCDQRVSAAPDAAGIANYLAVNRFVFQSPHTFYERVHRLRPAEMLRATRRGVTARVYWRLAPASRPLAMPDDELIARVRDLMLDAVRIRSRNHATGAALSGGFDSSSIVCMLARCQQHSPFKPGALHTFSFDFGSDDADEIDLIDAVAAATGATHHHVDGLTPALFEDLGQMIQVHDGPLLESSVLLLWAKKRVARQYGVKVLLSGLGGDEVFMGTLHYLSDLLMSGRIRAFLAALNSAYPVDLSSGRRTALRDVLKAYVLSPLIPQWIRALRKRTDGRDFPPRWVLPAFATAVGLNRALPASDFTAPTAFAQQQYDLFHFELLGGPIGYHEEASAAHDLETRFPLLDLRLVELLFDVDRPWKLDGAVIRRLQKSAMREFLPPPVLEEHLKKNFHHALHRYTRQLYAEPFKRYVSRSNQISRAYVDIDHVRNACAAYLSGAVNDPSPIWLAYNLERWLETL